MDGVDSRSSSRVHFLGAIREESSDDCGQRAHEIAHGAKGGAGRTRPARRAVAMSAVRSDAARGIRKPPYARTLLDRKSTRLNSSHVSISYAVFCLKKKKKIK